MAMQTRPTVSALHEAMRAVDADAALQTIDHGMVARAEDLRRGEERKWHEDEALADAANSVLRMIRRNGRQVFSRHDARMLREMHERLRLVQPDGAGAENDQAFGECV